MQTILYNCRTYGFWIKPAVTLITLTLSRSIWLVLTSGFILLFLFMQFAFEQKFYLLHIDKKVKLTADSKFAFNSTAINKRDNSISFRYDTDYNESIIFGETKFKSQKLPNCLIIGVRKGGTRALLDALSLHPLIHVARREIHFFDKLANYEQGLEWYRQQMPFTTKNQITIEKTPAYFVNDRVPFRVKQLNPSMKLILIVRDPVIRMISDFTQVLHTKLERNKTQITFKEAIFLKNSSKLNHLYKPVRNSLYAEHFQNWLRQFPLNQILILDGDKFVNNPLDQLKLAENFLNLSNRIRQDQLVFNKKKGFFCFRRDKKKTARCLGETKGRPQYPVSKAIKMLVTKNLRAENLRFFAQIKQVFSSWH